MTKDILKTLNLYSDTAGNNIAAELISDHKSFPGIDIVRFGNNIDVFSVRELIENISIIKQLELTLTMFEKYYSIEIIDGSKRRKTEYCIEKVLLQI